MESDCAGTEICSSLRVSSAFAPPRSLESATAFCIGVPFSEICSSQARSELLKATTTRSSSDSRRKNIRVLIRSEMPELASAKRGMFAPNPQQFLDIRENLLLFAGSPGLHETVIRVFGPSAGKIPPVVRVAASRHSNLIAVIDLRNAANHEQRCGVERQRSQRQPEASFNFAEELPSALAKRGTS